MTRAIERLCALLDKRGVKWWCDHDEPAWVGNDGLPHYARQEFSFSGQTNEVTVYHLTPEQAIYATLGRGTCEVIGFDDGYDEGLDGEWFALAPATWFLSCDHEAHGRRPSYCPVCGRKVVK